jgi:phosphate transport system substrate-binding protein
MGKAETSHENLQKERKVTLKRSLFATLAAVVVVAAGLAVSAGAGVSRSTDGSIVGAGSSFAAPLMTAWYQYYNAHSDTNVSYNSVGSGAGIAAITARTVDFGASDAPLTPDQFTNCKSCVQIPVLLGATAVLYNVPGVTAQLKLTGPVLADIYLGKVTQWNDPKIAALNNGVKLPSMKITPAYRSDGSGTSYNLTDYLSAVSPEWKSRIGKSTQPAFPLGVGARGSSGVSGVVTNTPGGIGYADVAYALTNHLRVAKMRNKAGVFATPGIRAAAAAASTIKTMPADNAVSIVDPPLGKKTKTAYPISTFTWVIVPQEAKNAQAVKRFILFAISKQGQGLGLKLLYAPIPDVVRVAAAKTVAKIHQAG